MSSPSRQAPAPESTSPERRHQSWATRQPSSEDNERLPLLKGSEPERRWTSALEKYGHWRNNRWTPQKNRGLAKLSVVVLSAFANIAPVGCMVVSRPTSGILPSLVLMLVFMGLSLYGAHLVSGALIITGLSTLPELWREVVGPRTAVIPMLSIAIACFACCVGYQSFYGHCISRVFKFHSPIKNLWCEDIYIIFSLVPMSVLVCLKDIQVMRLSTAVAGLSCIFCLLFCVWRFFDGSYDPDTGKWGHVGQWHPGYVPPRPPHDQHDFGFDDLMGYKASASKVITAQAVVFLFHFNAAKYFRELEYPKKDQYIRGVAAASGLGYFTMAGMMIFSYLTFGPKSSASVLDMYASKDHFAAAARLFFGLGVMGCFPLLFAGMREALVEFLTTLLPSLEHVFTTVLFQNIFSLCLLACVTLVTCTAHTSDGFQLDVRLNNIGRSVFGSLLIYVIPPIVYYRASRKHMTQTALTTPCLILMAMMLLFGLVMAVFSLVTWLS